MLINNVFAYTKSSVLDFILKTMTQSGKGKTVLHENTHETSNVVILIILVYIILTTFKKVIVGFVSWTLHQFRGHKLDLTPCSKLET